VGDTFFCHSSVMLFSCEIKKLFGDYNNKLFSSVDKEICFPQPTEMFHICNQGEIFLLEYMKYLRYYVRKF
jgi:hypothetical protein